MKKTHLLAALLIAMAVLIASASLAQNASAASIDNYLSTSQYSVRSGKYITVTSKTVYVSPDVNSVEIPMLSNFRTEVPYYRFFKPQTIKSKGNVGSWKKGRKDEAVLQKGTIWYLQSDESGFVGKTTWYAKFKMKAKTVKKTKTAKISHGQSTFIFVGKEGYPSSLAIKCKK